MHGSYSICGPIIRVYGVAPCKDVLVLMLFPSASSFSRMDLHQTWTSNESNHF